MTISGRATALFPPLRNFWPRHRKGTTNKKHSSYLTQLFQNALLHAALFEINSRTVDHLINNGLVNRSDRLVRHGDLDRNVVYSYGKGTR